MELALLSHGCKLSIQGKCFVAQSETDKKLCHSSTVSAVTLGPWCSVTTPALLLCAQLSIPVYVQDCYGAPKASVNHFSTGGRSEITRAQLFLRGNAAGLSYAQAWLGEKLQNRITLLREISHGRKSAEARSLCAQAIAGMESYRQRILALNGSGADAAATLRGLEGSAGRFYFGAISQLLPQKYGFAKRSTHPAADPYNALLNYGYAILYSKANSACIRAGLDPTIGILHIDRSDAPALVLDYVECWRGLAEKAVYEICRQDALSDRDMDCSNGAVVLSAAARKMVSEKIADALSAKVRYKGKSMSQEEQIERKAADFARDIVKEVPHDGLGTV